MSRVRKSVKVKVKQRDDIDDDSRSVVIQTKSIIDYPADSHDANFSTKIQSFSSPTLTFHLSEDDWRSLSIERDLAMMTFCEY